MLLSDTGPLVATANARDQHRTICQDLLEVHDGPVLVPAPVIVEVCQLLASRRGADSEAAFLASIAAGELEVIDLQPVAYTRAAARVTQYADLPLGAVDATVIAVMPPDDRAHQGLDSVGSPRRCEAAHHLRRYASDLWSTLSTRTNRRSSSIR